MSRGHRYSDRRQRRRKALPVLLAIVLAVLGSSFAAVNIWPDLGAQSADVLRNMFGDQVVAQLETAVFQLQDAIQGIAYQLGEARPAAPWATPLPTAVSLHTNPAVVQTPISSSSTTGDALALSTSFSAPLPAPTARPEAEQAPAPSSATAWTPAPIPALGTLAGAGQWSAYLSDPAGKTIAYRTFIQPDPDRPYAVTAIVAFDLWATRLHFVLGSEEPHSSVVIRRTGKISARDLRPGVLLAAFNGGFKARHGQFGAMTDGVVVLPPKANLGTIAMYRDGRVRIGAWGTDITADQDLLAWRQNGPLVIHHRQINPHTADTTSRDWGIILNGVTAVWRSGLGISSDDRTLYYVAGNSLTLPALVHTLAATGAAEALQLDINVGMVHFDAIQTTAAGLVPAPLFDTMKWQRDDRYLSGDKRDYFYVTARAN